MAKSKQEAQPEKTKTRTTVYYPDVFQKKMKYICYKDDTTQTDIILTALADYFAKWERKNGEISI